MSGEAGAPRPDEASARGVAARVLVRVFADRAFAAAALDTDIERHPQMDPRDRGLATELVYGVLRTKGFLEERLRAHSKRDLPSDPGVLANLLIGAYSLLFLDRIPAFAAVDQAVSGVRSAASAGAAERGAEGTARYANAVLRAISRDVERAGRPAIEGALAAGAPGWLRGALRRSLGRKEATSFLEAGRVAPPLGLAVRSASDRAAVAERLAAAVPAASIELGRHSPRALLLRGASDPDKLPGIGDDFIVQEEGAQIVALALGARPGERVLDACAGRGNKSWFLAGEIGAGGKVVAADLHPAKLAALVRRGGAASGVEVHAVDWTVGPGDVPDDFDRAIVDAPCSGIGTLARRPEIALFRAESDVADLAELQARIVRTAATRVKDGGRLVFAVCSVLRDEGEGVVDELVAPNAGDGVRLEPAPFDTAVPEILAGKESVRLLPELHGTDGYFLASFVVRRVSRSTS